MADTKSSSQKIIKGYGVPRKTSPKVVKTPPPKPTDTPAIVANWLDGLVPKKEK